MKILQKPCLREVNQMQTYNINMPQYRYDSFMH